MDMLISYFFFHPIFTLFFSVFWETPTDDQNVFPVLSSKNCSGPNLRIRVRQVEFNKEILGLVSSSKKYRKEIH